MNTYTSCPPYNCTSGREKHKEVLELVPNTIIIKYVQTKQLVHGKTLCLPVILDTNTDWFATINKIHTRMSGLP